MGCLRSRNQSQSQSQSLVFSQNHSQSPNQLHAPALGNLVLMRRTVDRNGATVVQAALTAIQNQLGHPTVVLRLQPRVLARGSPAVMSRIVDRSGAIVARRPHIAMLSRLGLRTVALLCGRRWSRRVECNAIGNFSERVSFRQRVQLYSRKRYTKLSCEIGAFLVQHGESLACIP